ncbi:MAG: glutathione S-transferase [Candidimonas sp.]|jgi:glutathione S-transferase
MKLFHSPASPFVRKVLISAHERGIADRLELVRAVVSPIARDERVSAHNPSGHIPTLLLDDGNALYDSGVICQYLDALHGGEPLFPVDPERSIRALCLQALCDGVLDAGVLMRFEAGLRPEAMRWPAWYDGQRTKVRSSLAVLERDWMSWLAGPLDIGIITAACALGYLDFRFPQDPWRPEHPVLARWYENFSRRDSMLATQHSAVV